MSGTSRRKASRGGRSGSRAAAPPASSALAWAEGLAGAAPVDPPADGAPGAPDFPGVPEAPDEAPAAEAPSPFGRAAGVPWGGTTGPAAGEWSETHTLGVGISPEIAAAARARAAGGSPFGSPFGTTTDAGPATSVGSPFGAPGTAETAPPSGEGPAGGEPDGAAGPWGAVSPVPATGRRDKAEKPGKGGRGKSKGKGRTTEERPARVAPVDEAVPDESSVGQVAGPVADPMVDPAAAPEPADGGPAAIPPKRRRVRPGQVDPDVAPPSIAPARRSRGGGHGDGSSTRVSRRRLGVPPFADKPLVLVLAGVVALGLGLGAGWVQGARSEAEDNLPPTTPQACASATWAWAQSNSAQSVISADDPVSLRTGFMKARDALDGVAPPAAIAEDWATVQSFITAMATSLEPVDPANPEALLAAANEGGTGLDQPKMTEAAGRVQEYLSRSCAD
ncbi:hypothetical protein [Antribacter gilvus]|uniref:hypothetical protein n=1 Tax=Antribacter gilvus TaxID=2304675 RepID=UPI000F772C92|nr:hypothetical protein [Antribacter gilvus]